MKKNILIIVTTFAFTLTLISAILKKHANERLCWEVFKEKTADLPDKESSGINFHSGLLKCTCEVKIDGKVVFKLD